MLQKISGQNHHYTNLSYIQYKMIYYVLKNIFFGHILSCLSQKKKKCMMLLIRSVEVKTLQYLDEVGINIIRLIFRCGWS